MKTGGNKEDGVVRFGNTALLAIVALGLILAVGSGIWYSRVNANLVPTNYASAAR